MTTWQLGNEYGKKLAALIMHFFYPGSGLDSRDILESSVDKRANHFAIMIPEDMNHMI